MATSQLGEAESSSVADRLPVPKQPCWPKRKHIPGAVPTPAFFPWLPGRHHHRKQKPWIFLGKIKGKLRKVRQKTNFD